MKRKKVDEREPLLQILVCPWTYGQGREPDGAHMTGAWDTVPRHLAPQAVATKLAQVLEEHDAATVQVRLAPPLVEGFVVKKAS